MAVVLTPEASMLAAVPESLLANAVSKRSKRRATLSTGDSIERATKLKAARNLDKSFTEVSSDTNVIDRALSKEEKEFY
ncbi:hypothetical protein ZEAMMB73_Zm00001d021997 [Zea mays]|uniref:Uncharacterized protein n=1 Tax=Zea mays TaxID=4577 RepID=A0A1D6IIC0_MAIZE|nr:hypothetical protein ZEAMMB73_Zm00001d021997 [Zea mays]